MEYGSDASEDAFWDASLGNSEIDGAATRANQREAVAAGQAAAPKKRKYTKRPRVVSGAAAAAAASVAASSADGALAGGSAFVAFENGDPVYTFRSLDPTDEMRNDDDEEESVNPTFCFECTMRASHSLDGGNPFIRRLHDIIRDGYGVVSPEALTRQVQTYYNENIRHRIANEEERLPWRKNIIWEHIELHAPSRYTDTLRNLRIIRQAMTVLTQRMQLCNTADPTDAKIDTENLKMYVSLLRQQQRLNIDADTLASQVHTSEQKEAEFE